MNESEYRFYGNVIHRNDGLVWDVRRPGPDVDVPRPLVRALGI